MISLKKWAEYSIYLYVVVIVFASSVGDISVRIVRVIVAALLFLYFLSRRFSFRKSKYCLWAAIFLAYNAIVANFAYNRSMASEYVVSLFYVLLVNVLACQFLIKNDCIEGIWKSYIAGATFKAIRTYAQYGLLAFLNTRATSDTSANSIGLYCAYAVIFCLMFYWRGVKGEAGYRRNKYWYLLLCGLNLIFMILSASRKAFVYLLIPIVVLLIQSSKNLAKTLRNVFLSILLCGVFFVLMMKIPFLYRLVGRRIELMISGLLGGSTDSSTNTRLLLIQHGITWFKERPLFGYGMLNFKAINNFYRGSSLYAHNNYIELLIDGGIVGTILYYSLYWMLIRWGLEVRKYDRLKALIVLGIIVSMLVGEFGMVTYYTAPYQFLLMSFYAYLAVKRKEIRGKGI